MKVYGHLRDQHSTTIAQRHLATSYHFRNLRFMNSPPRDSVASPVHDYLSDLRREVAEIRGGSMATYIPELARASASRP